MVPRSQSPFIIERRLVLNTFSNGAKGTLTIPISSPKIMWIYVYVTNKSGQVWLCVHDIYKSQVESIRRRFRCV